MVEYRARREIRGPHLRREPALVIAYHDVRAAIGANTAMFGLVRQLMLAVPPHHEANEV